LIYMVAVAGGMLPVQMRFATLLSVATPSPHPVMSAAASPVWFNFFSGKRTLPATAEMAEDQGPQIVRDLMAASVISLDPDMSLNDAAKELRKNGITGAPVVQDGKLIGVLSQTDLLYRLTKGSRRSVLKLPGGGLPKSVRFIKNTEILGKQSAVQVRCAMTVDPISIGPDAPTSEAAALMLNRKLNRLMVVEDKQLVGVISARDLVKLALKGEPASK